MFNLLLLTCFVFLGHAELQHSTVRGITMCSKNRTTAKVELYEADTLDPDDFLNSTITNSAGEFELSGSEDEIGSIDPYIIIIHQCNAKNNCYRFSKYYVPQSTINGVYEMTFISLDIITADDRERC